MIDLFFFNDLPVAVMGLGKSGLATAAALQRSGAEVWAWDDDPAHRAAAGEEGIPIVDLASCDWRELTTLVLSPGIPHTHPKPHPVAAAAKAAGCEIIGDIELLARAQREAGYIGITGTNGKSTTTSLIGYVLGLSGAEVEVGGNLGTPVLTLRPLFAGGTYVLEMSSYQLELTHSITFDVAVLLNITPDHLDRHGGMEGYTAAKKRIFHRQTHPRAAVVGVDDPISRGIFEELRKAGEQRVIGVSSKTKVPGGVYVRDGVLIDDIDGAAVPALDLREVATLPGAHNGQNAAAAYAACRAIGVAAPVIAASIRSFPGLAHRQELVATIGDVKYVNDSKATNADAAEKALVCYDAIYWIAGGRAKEGGIESLRPHFPRIRHAFLIGEAADAFAATLGSDVAWTKSGDLATAVVAAHAQAQAEKRAGAVVLLSPACASWDQFANFEARGDAFRSLVQNLGPAGGRA